MRNITPLTLVRANATKTLSEPPNAKKEFAQVASEGSKMPIVAVQSAHYHTYLRLDASNFIENNNNGGGVVNAQFDMNGSEQFNMEETGDNSVTLESCNYPGYFLRMDGQGITQFMQSGGGVVNAQNSAHAWEKFKIISNDDGTVSFESAQFPNVYLRMYAPGLNSKQPNGGGQVDCQFGASQLERYHIYTIQENQKSQNGNAYQTASIDFDNGAVRRDLPSLSSEGIVPLFWNPTTSTDWIDLPTGTVEATDITRYSLYYSKGWIYNYSFWIDVRRWFTTYLFRDKTGDEYEMVCVRPGIHKMFFNSSDPELTRVTITRHFDK